MINVLIADDENHARNRLKELLQKYPDFKISSEAKTGDEVIQLIVTKKPDVAFLDINMPGVSVFNSIPSLKNPPLIIFQSAYSEYAVDAFGINALDYILKPISEERFAQTIEKIQAGLKDNTKKESFNNKKLTKLTVKINGTIKVIDINDIYKITIEDGFSSIYTKSEKFLSDNYLNFFEKKLEDTGFFRVSREAIINTKYISIIHPMFKGSYVIELTNNDKINLSRRRAQQLKKIISF